MATRRRAVLASVQLLASKPTAFARSSSPAASSVWSGQHHPSPNVRGIRTCTNAQWPQQHPQYISRWTAQGGGGCLQAQMQGWRDRRRMSCCAGLGSPPPREIVVEYSSGEDDYTEEFIKLANAIEEAYPEFVVSGNPDVVTPRKGAFEITAGESILFSKLKMNRLPECYEVLTAIEKLPPLECTLS